MDFHSLAAAHFAPTGRDGRVRLDEERYYRSCPDLASLRPRAFGRLVVLAVIAVVFVTIGQV